jgi:WD40 repeat protein
MRVATVVLTLILLAICSGAGGDGAPGSPVVPSGSRVVPSPTNEALTGSPIDLTSLSGRIVFDNFQDVWSINADGTGLTRLTRASGPDAHDFDATWSPDGKQIAYRHERNSGYPEIWVMNADGWGSAG